MLDTLITSKTRVKLLMKFFLNPGTRAYLRELASEFDESTNSVRVELNRLSKAKIITAENVGRTIEYHANEEHSLFNELQALVQKYAGIDKLIETLIKKLGDVETKVRANYGFVEESNNKIKNLEEKLNLIDKDFQSRIEKIEKEIKILSKVQSDKRKTSINQKEMKVPKASNLRSLNTKDNLGNSKIELTQNGIKKKI